MSSWAMIRTMSAMLCTLVVCSGHAQAQTQNQDQIAQRLQFVNELCLSGTQYDLHADTKGNIVIKKLTPGSQGSATISKREAERVTASYDKKLEIIADFPERACTKAYIQGVFNVIKQESSNAGAPNIRKSKRIDLSGLWLANGYICRGVVPEEKVRIKHVGNSVTAIKEKGDECIRSDETTFTGTYDGTKPTVSVEIQNRYPNASTIPLRETALLEIVSADAFILTYRDIKITFERNK